LPGATDVTYIGSVLWQQAGASLPGSITSLSTNKPLVWVYSGNPKYGKRDDSLDSLAVIEGAIAAFATMDVHVVVTTGHHGLPSSLAPLPNNFVHEPYVPGLAMAARCDVLVHHGGYGSCQTGLHAGKPAVILPTYSERESNARRMAAIGAAIIVPVVASSTGKSVDPHALATAVTHALSDRSLARNARAAGEKLRAEGGPERAAELIEALGQARS
jgi:UDP:flavonoid glycosyltransferase YjiC (YdhE family)